MAAAYSHLSFEERALLETQLRLGMRPAAIAAALLRARSTISREMRHNGWQPDRASGRAASASPAAIARCPRIDVPVYFACSRACRAS